MNFSDFSKPVQGAFQAIVAGDVYVVGIEPDVLWSAYLAAFPEGTNPIRVKRAEHDCATCRQFVRRAGGVVAVGGPSGRQTAWDLAAREAPEPYRTVATAMRDLVRVAPITDIFRVGSSEGAFGALQTRSLCPVTGQALTWNHFHTGPIPDRFRALSPEKVRERERAGLAQEPFHSSSPDKDRGDYRTAAQVFDRGLRELKAEAVGLVMDLIGDDLYRGAEHRPAVVAFQAEQAAYLALDEASRPTFAFTRAGGPVARFRNTVIGTLVQDLSEGVPLERAVAAFESKVAPANYKRTKAPITPAMVELAMRTIRDLDLEPALERRLARLADVSVRDVLWVDSQVGPLMRDGIGNVLMRHAREREPTGQQDAEPIDLDAFLKDVAPGATGIDVLFQPEHAGNLMVLTAPVNAGCRNLFRWDNDFAWSYAGEVADSIRERVKRAGGQVTGVRLRVSLSWDNYDDLDVHVLEPGSGPNGAGHIYYAHRHGAGGGVLDVDMNAGSGTTREAVENVVWQNPPDGTYLVQVNNFCLRETADVGFTIEIENEGRLIHLTHAGEVKNRNTVVVVALHMKDGVLTSYEVKGAGIRAGAPTQERWGIQTGSFIPCQAITLSPNYWGDNRVGNRHTFFVLDGARCDEPARGIYNEFLHARLEAHRKVFEVIGQKTRCQPTSDQMVGLGFSSTRRDVVPIRVTTGRRVHLFNVQMA